MHPNENETMEQDYITTSDLPLAAYLMLQGFTLITCVDPEDGNHRYDFYLTHADADIRQNIYMVLNKYRDQYGGPDNSYQDFYNYTRKLRKAAIDPVRKSQWGSN